MTQVPVVQVPVALAGAHACPQAPQFWTVLSGVSQPLVGSLSQSPNPCSQLFTHLPPVQVKFVVLAPVQTTPQPPQFWWLVARCTHFPLHLVVWLGQPQCFLVPVPRHT